MLKHYAIFLWFLGEKDGFKTESSLSEGGLGTFPFFILLQIQGLQ